MTMKRTRWESPEVAYCEDEVPCLDAADVAALGIKAGDSTRRRARICAHRSRDDGLHEMIIALDRGGYVRPHRHLGRTESFHVISGAATLLLFEEDGTPRARLPVGDVASGRGFFVRLDQPVFHALVVESEQLVFHEVTTGPFDPASSEPAPWAPGEGDAGAGRRFLESALQRLGEGA
jgi:cupin fold WbuC family metalloprotein